MADKLTPFQEKVNQRPCPVCGHKEFEWGWMQYASYRQKMGLYLNFKSIAVRRCLNCNNLLQFVDENRTRQSNTAVIVFLIVFLILAAVLVFWVLQPDPLLYPRFR